MDPNATPPASGWTPQPGQQPPASWPPQPDQQPPVGWTQPGAPVPARARGSWLPLVGGIAIVIAIVVGVVFFLGGTDANAGKVIFTTDQPSTGVTTCHDNNVVTSIKAGTAVYATFHFKSRAGSDPLSISWSKDGTVLLPPTQFPASVTTEGLDCVKDVTNYSLIFSQPGTYTITITDNGTTVAEGSLTITS